MTKKLPLLLCAIAFLLLPPSAPYAEEAQSSFQLDATVALSGCEALVESQLEWALVGLRALASTDEATSRDWSRMKALLAKLGEGIPEEAAIWFARPDGSYFTVEKDLTDQNLKDRSYFPALMAGSDVEGDLVVSKSTGKKSIIVATPVKNGGAVVGALGISIGAERLAQMVDEKLRLPSDVVFYALDAKGQTALHRETKLMFEFPSEMGSPSLSSAVETMLAEPEGSVRYSFDGKEKVAVFRASKATGWVFVVGRAQ